MALNDRLDPAVLATLQGKPKGRYGGVAQRTEYGGKTYDSKAEATYAAKLDILVKAEKCDWWLRQVWIPLGPDFCTRVDFLVAKPILCINSNVATYIYAAEVKGFETPQFKKIRTLWPKYAPFPLHVIKKDQVEIIEAGR